VTTSAAEASAAFARALGAPARSAAGIEHEYRVMRGGQQVDFRTIVHDLGLGPRDLDPLDAHAYHLASGIAVTADRLEAEVVTPPVELHRDHPAELESRAAAGRAELETRLAPGDRLDGFSTHVSVSVTSAQCEEVALLYARTFAPALTMLMDRADSPGVLVRPRPGRLELCGEFVTGPNLRAAITFAVGSVRACMDAVSGAPERLPPAVRLRLEPARARYGWYVGHRAIGARRKPLGRATRFRLADRRMTSAQLHLEACWRIARSVLERDGIVDALHLRTVDDLVAGRAMLPCESGSPDRRGGPDPSSPHAFGALIGPVTRNGFALAPVMVTWRTAVLLVGARSRERMAFACVPGAQVRAFVEQLDVGALDDAIEQYLAMERTPRRLAGLDQTAEPGLFDELGSRHELLPLERAPIAR
jgi:hypothetical protein